MPVVVFVSVYLDLYMFVNPVLLESMDSAVWEFVDLAVS